MYGEVYLQLQILKQHVYKEIGQHVKNMSTNTVNQPNWKDVYDRLMNSRIITLTMNKIFT